MAGAPRRRGRILTSLLLLLFVVGVVPLVGTSLYLVRQARADLELDQKTIQLAKARSLSQQIAMYSRGLRSQMAAIARTLEMDPTGSSFGQRGAEGSGHENSGGKSGLDQLQVSTIRHDGRAPTGTWRN